jgi:deazaflavin-dependent oxidoreductase (nitroreductase family)
MEGSASTPSGHGRFAVVNKTVNPLLRALLRSPLHRIVSGRLALITVTGRRSGREYTFPVGYRRDGDRVLVGVEWPERKVWWRNLRGGGPVRIRVAGRDHPGHAQVREDERGVTVEVTLT